MSTRLMLALGRAAQVIITERDDADFFQRLCAALCAGEPIIAAAWIGFLRSGDDRLIDVTAAAGGDLGIGPVLDLSLASTRACPLIKALRSGDTQCINRPSGWDDQVAAIFTIPIRHDGRSGGALSLYLTVPMVFTSVQRGQFLQHCQGIASGIAFYRLRQQSGPMRARLAAIVESSSDAIISKDLTGIVTSWNGGAERIYGYPAAEAVGRHISFIAPPHRKAEIGGLIARIMAGENIAHFETERVTKDGQRKDISLTLSPIRDRSGDIIGISTIAQDITLRRATERQVRELTSEIIHMSRLREVGQFSAFLAHELNQPLAAVMNYVEAARYAFGEGGSPSRDLGRDLLSRAAAQTERAAEIIRRLRGLVEKRPVERQPQMLASIVEDACALAVIGTRVDNISVTTDFDLTLPPLSIDKVQIQQVVVNLVRNAVEVLKHAPQRLLTVQVSAASDGQQQVVVADSGPGVAPEVAGRLFQPFATSKSDGMGLGLSISQSIVESHGGRIWFEPNPSGGACFRFSLPATGGA